MIQSSLDSLAHAVEESMDLGRNIGTIREMPAMTIMLGNS